MAERGILFKILDLARWAPSGDNTQPWRFEVVSGDHIVVYGFDTRDWCLYDFDGRPSYMAHGALLETLRIAATGFGLDARWAIRAGCTATAPVYDVTVHEAPGLAADPLLSHIETRVVQRRPMHTTPLSAAQRERLVAATGPGFQVQFFESFAERFEVAKLLWGSAHVRLTCPEAYAVHKEIIEWGARFSKDRIPEEAVGVDPMTARLMRWVMQSWARVEFFNRYLLGTVAPRIQLDFIPAMACAAHVLLRPRRPLTTHGDCVEAGVAMQRLWLTVAALGLYLQPQMTPVIFRWYAQAARPLSAKPGIDDAVRLLASRFDALTGSGATDPFAFFCRVGNASQPVSRSIRRSLDELMTKP
ncbi:nitroreductase family protein [Aromatoleum toluolicum]|uniref:Molybdopterin biosynthesis protein MoeY n=1 Tax=Aromatoleum toluolicum TaxID=90060 RepID=A0ABX1NC27_9RHOO|nr:nitroreductase family protein [Aromatoleum toluolicum]